MTRIAAQIALITLSALIGVSDAGAQAPNVEPEPESHPFAQGGVRAGFGAGVETGPGRSPEYRLAGSFGYFVLDGLEAGIQLGAQFGDGPTITRLSPQILALIAVTPELVPYVGPFYTHWFISQGVQDLDTVGGRLGLLYLPDGSGAVVGFGAAYERIVRPSCSEECEYFYPEIMISFTF